MGYISALRYWRAVTSGSAVLETAESSRAGMLSTASAGRDAMRAIDDAGLGFGQGPLHLLVSNACDCRRSSGIVSHLCSVRLPRGAFVRLASDVHVASPELLFVQMALEATRPELIELGFELCGQYRLSADKRGFRYAEPLATVSSMKGFMDGLRMLRGKRLAGTALRYVIEGSASPAETLLAMLLCCPTSLGGWGLPPCQMNARVSVPEQARSYTWMSHFTPDLLWRERRVVAEYDSRIYHGDAVRFESDKDRSDAIQAMGYKVVTFTTRHLSSYGSFEQAVSRLAKALGHRIYKGDFSTYTARSTLYDWLRTPQHQLGLTVDDLNRF